MEHPSSVQTVEATCPRCGYTAVYDKEPMLCCVGCRKNFWRPLSLALSEPMRSRDVIDPGASAGRNGAQNEGSDHAQAAPPSSDNSPEVTSGEVRRLFVGLVWEALKVPGKAAWQFFRAMPDLGVEARRSARSMFSSPSRGSGADLGEIYTGGVQIVGTLAFLAAWVYAIMTYGYFLGIGLGWIPALVIGAIVGLAWPLILFGGGLIVFGLYIAWAVTS